MDCSDNENNSDDDVIDEILGPEDLFNDEADEGDQEEHDYRDDEAKGENEQKNEGDEVKKQKSAKLKRVVKNPRVNLNFDTLNGPNGLSALKKLFENFKFKGSNHEKEDLTKIMGILQQWMCYRLCPSYDFESIVLQLENLGKKKSVQTLMKKYRMGMDDWGGNKSDDDLVDNNDGGSNKENDFDLLLREDFDKVDTDTELMDDEIPENTNSVDSNQLTQSQSKITLTAEQLERIERSKKMAEERRLKRLSEQQGRVDVHQTTSENSEGALEAMNIDENSVLD